METSLDERCAKYDQLFAEFTKKMLNVGECKLQF